MRNRGAAARRGVVSGAAHPDALADFHDDVSLRGGLIVHTASKDEHDCRDTRTRQAVMSSENRDNSGNMLETSVEGEGLTQGDHHEGSRDPEGQRVALPLGVDPTFLNYTTQHT